MILLAAVIQASSFSLVPISPKAFEVLWNGKKVLSGIRSTVTGEQRHSEPAESLYLGYPHGPKTAEFVPDGRTRESYTVTVDKCSVEAFCSADSFACSDDPDCPLGGSVGRPIIPQANSIYDRTTDLLITFKARGVGIVPTQNHGFSILSSEPCGIVFKPNYYRDHLGYFLWDKKKPLWTKPVAGWCSWMGHLQDVKESDVLAAAHFFADNLKAYGYNIIQIDDGYQRVMQFGQDKVGQEPFSSYWTKPNDKFPSGMESLAHRIKDLGLTPGIWVGYYAPLGLQHREGYVADPDGRPHKGPWVNFAMNGLEAAGRDEAYIDTIREFKRQGWDYFKIDTLRHILYDNYRQTPLYWKSRGESMEQAYRTILAETKKAAGSSYLLACWGTIPELAGLADGARIGEDVGPDFDSMRRSAKYIAQFQYLNNVVWHNDPDYMCFRVSIEQARTWATMNFMAGGHLMVSDPIADYDATHLDALRRVGPPIYVRPLNVISHAPDPEFMMLAAEKGEESWTVYSRFAWQDLPPVEKAFDAVASDSSRYLAFDFWNEKFLGSVARIPFHALAKGSCQVIAIRPDLGRPQVLGTNRHMSQGVYELEGVRWDGHKLSGMFKRGPGQAWSLYLHLPHGWKVAKTSEPFVSNGEVLKLTFPITGEPIDWSVSFDRA